MPANAVISPDGTFVALAALLDAAKLNMFKGRSDAASAPDLDGVLGVMRSSDEGKTLQPMAPIADVYVRLAGAPIVDGGAGRRPKRRAVSVAGCTPCGPMRASIDEHRFFSLPHPTAAARGVRRAS